MLINPTCNLAHINFQNSENITARKDAIIIIQIHSIPVAPSQKGVWHPKLNCHQPAAGQENVKSGHWLMLIDWTCNLAHAFSMFRKHNRKKGCHAVFKCKQTIHLSGPGSILMMLTRSNAPPSSSRVVVPLA